MANCTVISIIFYTFIAVSSVILKVTYQNNCEPKLHTNKLKTKKFKNEQ